MSYQLDAVVLAAAEALVDYYNPLRAESGLPPAEVDEIALAHARYIVDRIVESGMVSVPYRDDVSS